MNLPEPVAGDGEVLVDIHAIGINFPDLLATKGQYQHKPDLPFVPGCEIAGVIRSAPDGSGWGPGQRVAAFVWQGGFAQVASVPPRALVEVLDETELSTAAMVVNYHTVLFALDRRARTQRGERVLVLGAAGGIGTAGLQVAKGLGARVVGGVANDEQRATAVAAGADEVVVLAEGFAAQLRELTGGRGVDVVLDPLGDWIFDEAVRAFAPEGRILVVGFAAGGIPKLAVNRLLLRNAAAVGVAWSAFLDLDPRLMKASGQRLKRDARRRVRPAARRGSWSATAKASITSPSRTRGSARPRASSGRPACVSPSTRWRATPASPSSTSRSSTLTAPPGR
ncbi:MAG: NADPH:quinone oxidoreductase family protein [Actinomycetota bacterium]|nr:NADPH:quinone oxidoreductase family protein [Actinomycetota bacterium]